MSIQARIIAALLIALALAAGAWRVHVKADKAGYARAQGEHAQAVALASEAARSKEQAAALALANTIKKAQDEKDDLRRRVAALADSLRHRPERPSGAAAPSPADPVACTGAELFRPDAAFLVREAGRADKLRIDLAACQAAYDGAVRLTE